MSSHNLSRPQDFEWDVSGALARCLICDNGRKDWIPSKQARRHELTNEHETSVAIRRQNANTREAHRKATDAVEKRMADDSERMQLHAYTTITSASNVALDYTYNTRIPELPAYEPGYGDYDDPMEEVIMNTNFSAGEVEDPSEQRRAYALAGLDISSDDEDGFNFADILLDSDEAPTAEELSNTLFGAEGDEADWFPYPNKGMMKTDILFSSPRLRFSRAQQHAILEWGKDLGAKEVPSMYALEKFQREGLKAIGDPMQKVTASSGNVFYTNSIRESIIKDYAHPDIRPHIHVFPEVTSQPRSEVWHGSKWLMDVPHDVLTPMVRVNEHDFYIRELLQCVDSSWFIPLRFLIIEGEMCAIGHQVQQTSLGFVVSDVQGTVSCAEFHLSWPEIEELNNGGRPVFVDASSEYLGRMPNPDRALADGLEWESCPILLFIDDVSGNVSKQWNVHYSCYMSNGGLSRQLLELERHIKFVATSPHASPMEIIEAVCKELEKMEPIRAWDVVRRRYILIRLWLLLMPGDNPMQAELCSHIGLQGNFFCRCCHVGGDRTFKHSDEGFPTLLKPGRPRDVQETCETISKQLELATHAAAERSVKELSAFSGVKDSFATPFINQFIETGKALRRPKFPGQRALSAIQVQEHLSKELEKKRKENHTLMNPLLHLPGFDVHKDTPVEPLHTHLLGVVKYFWNQTTWVLDKANKLTAFQERLDSLSQSGLNLPTFNAEYICRFRGSLIGKHFKLLSQLMSFAICDLVSNELQQAWMAVGQLTVLIWKTEFTDLEHDLSCLRRAIEEVNDFAASLSPSLITLKSKLHIITHLPEHCERFLSALNCSTERYEGFNAVFRLCSIHSNRQAPSRDIAIAFSGLDRCKHICTGGYWIDPKTQCPTRAGKSVQEHLRHQHHDAHLLGVEKEKIPVKGSMRFEAVSTKAPLLHWNQTIAYTINSGLGAQVQEWQRAQSIVTRSGDTAYIGDHVLIQINNKTSFAVIKEVIQDAHNKKSVPIISVQRSLLHNTVHSILRMPTIQDSGPMTFVSTQELVCVINVQHDCSRGVCTASATQEMRQERELSTRVKKIISHNDSTFFVINVLSLHNSRLLHAALPPHLIVSGSHFSDREALHKTAAKAMRDETLKKKLAQEEKSRKQASAREASSKNVQPDAMAETHESAASSSRQVRAGPSNQTDVEMPAFQHFVPRGPRKRTAGG